MSDVIDQKISETNISDTKKKKGGLVWTLVLVFLLAIVSRVALVNPFGGVSVGDEVEVTYVLYYADGSVYKAQDTSLSFVVGEYDDIALVNEELVGMKKGKTKTISLIPQDAYGKFYDKRKVQELSLLVFQTLNIVPKIGESYDFGGVKGVVVAIEGEGDSQIISFDTNPLYTWDDLTMDLTLVDVIE